MNSIHIANPESIIHATGVKNMNVNNKIYAALVKARKEFKTIELDKINPHFKSRFASLASINAGIVDGLANNGLMILQPWKDLENGDILLETVIVHESGEEIRSSCRLVRAGKSDQQFGASCSYIRRYQLSSLLGVVGEDDDDGESNQGRVNPPVDHKPKPKAPAYQPGSKTTPLPEPKITDKQTEEIIRHVHRYPESLTWIKTNYKIEAVNDLLAKDYDHVIGMFEKKKAKAEEKK